MSAGTYRVMRQDDAGNKFVVATGLSEEDAEAMVALFEARGRKQLYWAEDEEKQPDYSGCC